MQKVIFISLFAVVCQTVLTVGYERTWILRQKRMTNDDECQSIMQGPGKNLPLCCQMPNILPNMDNAWKECFEKFKQFKDKPETQEYKEMAHGDGPPCLFQCIFKQSGLVNNDGKLNEDMINKKMSEGMKDDERWKSLWQQPLDKCFDEVKNESTRIIPQMNTPAGRLMKCFLRDLYMNCPNDIWVDNSECMSIKNLLQKCPEMPPPVFQQPPNLI